MQPEQPEVIPLQAGTGAGTRTAEYFRDLQAGGGRSPATGKGNPRRPAPIYPRLYTHSSGQAGGGGRNDRCQTTIPGDDRRTNDTRRGSGTAIRHAGKQEAAARQRDRRQQERTQRTPGNATTPAAGGDTMDDRTAAGQGNQQHRERAAYFPLPAELTPATPETTTAEYCRILHPNRGGAQLFSR